VIDVIGFGQRLQQILNDPPQWILFFAAAFALPAASLLAHQLQVRLLTDFDRYTIYLRHRYTSPREAEPQKSKQSGLHDFGFSQQGGGPCGKRSQVTLR
jgi:hypothetical protein